MVQDVSTEPSALVAPTKADGSAYRYEMLHAGLTRRVYADDLPDFLDTLISGYGNAGHAEQWALRLALAARAQVYTQAILNTSPAYRQVTSVQRTILSGPRNTPVVVAHWDCPIPLVLIATDYQPAGLEPRPRPLAGMPPNVMWIDPSDEMSLLASLDEIGFVALHENDSTPQA